MSARYRPSARLIARGVDLIVHADGMPAVQVPGMTQREALAVMRWGEKVRADSPPLVVQTREINEHEGVIASRQDLEDAVRALYQAARNGVVDDEATRAFERSAPQHWLD